MDISITNCNNIESGQISILPKKLNIKYAINGTGKSSIAKAIQAHFSATPQKGFEALRPYGKEVIGTINGLESFQKAMIFNEEYVSKYLFKAEEVVTNSFEIFVKTPDYERHLKEIEEQVKDIKDTLFQDNPELNELSSNLQKFIDSFGKAATKVSVTSILGKGLSKGNKLRNIPKGLESYQEYLQSESPSSWLNWVFEGKKYGLISEKQCPYCNSDIKHKKENIELLNT